MGGNTLSITKGVVSRIEHTRYAQSLKRFLAVQVDAAINPGNSGGPAIIKNRVVGIAMQGIDDADNIGYIIPTPIIHHFLQDVNDGKYDGFPKLGIGLHDLTSPAQRKKYSLAKNQTGALVTKVFHGSPIEGKINVKDVLLAIDGHQIENDLSVEFRPRQWTRFSYYIQKHHIGEMLELTFLRKGIKETIRVTLNKSANDLDLIPLNYDSLPRYYVFGGLVFVPLTMNYILTWGDEWYTYAPAELLSILRSSYKSPEKSEVVLLLKVLASETNEGYHSLNDLVISKVNGEKISSLKDLIQVVEMDTGKYVVFEDTDGKEIVLNKKKAMESNNKILATYQIQQDRSQDLMASYHARKKGTEMSRR